jgi:CheY-like chemotaxis protein
MKKKESRRRILIVEDKPLVSKVVAMYVSGLGYEPIETDSGLSALAIAGSGKIDIILLDLGIPDIDGFEVLRRIKLDNNLHHIPVIITTARDDKETIIRCLNLKADDYMIKPIDPIMLGSRFEAILSGATKEKTKQPRFLVSLAKTGAGTQFLIAALLISVLPTITIVYILFAPHLNFYMSENATKWALSMILLLVIAGYMLLAKYPISIMRLRNYLALLAKGDFTQQIELGQDEDDLKTISNYISSIVKQTQDRIRTIEAQTETLIETETRRVMIESLGAACHHIGQPATVINTYLSMMRRRETRPEMQAMIDECQKASDDLANILEKLMNVTKYQAESYLPTDDSSPTRSDETILKIDK